MFKFKKWLIASIAILLIASSIFFYIFSLNVEKNLHEEIADTIKSYLDKILNKQKSQALTLAILLSQNEALKEALLDLDEAKGYEILSQSLQTLQQYTNIQGVRAQVIAKDLTIFARNWDKDFVGMPLDAFRKDLSSFKINKPKVAIETGRLLSIKATAPIKKGYKTIGYMEIISLFEPMTTEMRKLGIELIVLMHEKYLDVATLMRDNPVIGTYVISNRNYNKLIANNLTHEKLEKIVLQGYVYDGENLYFYHPMFNSVGENLGIFLIAINKEGIKKFQKYKDSLSFFLAFENDEFSDIIDIWEHPEGRFRSVYDRSVALFLGKNVDANLKKDFELELRDILKNYSKEELINIIVEKYRRTKKRGVIK
ncbi:cache domain-containing protein [Nitratiruptor sp. SB155-2]|uniref:cache domain-containing protein n=1 Tax=Nitratiruptor sp. (strain SB155-2) TaxID=387092 RepID=UPI000A031038